MSIELPVKVGDVLYIAEHHTTRVTRKCMVCAGHGSVWVRNIEGDEFEVRCEGCGKGYDACPGTEEYYDYEPRVTRFEVALIASVEFKGADLDMYLESTTKRTMRYSNLYKTEEEALAKSKEHMEATIRQNMASGLSRKKSLLPEHAWSVRYHNEQIKDAERRIAWHTTRLLSKKKGKSKHVAQH